MDTKVRVVVTTKNATNTIRNCLDSLMNLSCFCKIAVIDGGSTDGTVELVKDYCVDLVTGKYSRSEAYNLALKTFDEPIFALVDADCEVHPQWLDVLLQNLSEDVGIVGGWFTTSEDATFLEKLIGWEFYARKRRFQKYVTRLNTGNMMFPKKLALLVGGFDERVKANQDCAFSYKMLNAGYKIRYVEVADILHHHRSSWIQYFKQQYSYARDLPTVLLKNKGRVNDDTTHPLAMTLQPIILSSSMLFGTLQFIIPLFLTAYVVSLYFLVLLWAIDVAEITHYSKNHFLSQKQLLLYSLGLIPLFVVRAFAWMLGGITYIINKIRK